MTQKTFLQVLSAKSLVGKTIKWHAPASRWNEDYTGTATILSVDESNRRPLTTTTVEGDNLDFAFAEEDGVLFYSDGDRYITYQIIEND